MRLALDPRRSAETSGLPARPWWRLWPGGEAAAWAVRLEETSGELGNLARETEGEILGLGSRLEEFAQAAGRVSKQAAQVVEAIKASGQVSRAGEIFASASERLSAADGEIVSGLARLGAIGQRLERLFRFQRSLSHLTRTVRMLRVATRMETARLKEDQGLGMLADEIDKFSRRLDGHVAGLFEQAAEVAEKTARLSAALDLERRGYKERLDEAKQAATAALEQLRALLRQVAGLSGLTSRRSEEVVREVGEIVASLQFHDITRQQLEHVQKALAEAVGHLREGRRRAGAAVLRRILVLQRSQLHQVKGEIETAGQRIRVSLSGIAASCQAQANDLAPLAGQDAERRGLRSLEERMATLAEILEQGSHLSQRMLDSTRAAASLLARMEGGLGAIQAINEELNLLALNALVKVSHQGEAGRALAEVAEAVNRLSLEPRKVVTQAAEEVCALLVEARELGTLHEAALAANQEQAVAVAGAAAEALRGLRELGREVKGAVSSLAADSEELLSRIGAVAGGVRFDSLVAERVEAAAGLLEGCCDTLAGAGSNGGGGQLQALERRYTMESERLVHRVALEEEAPPPAAAQGEELGDNVELF